METTPSTPSTPEHGASLRIADAVAGVVCAVLLLAASWADAGSRWVASPRVLDAAAVGLILVAAGALVLRPAGDVRAPFGAWTLHFSVIPTS